MKWATNLDNQKRYSNLRKQKRWSEFSSEVITETAQQLKDDPSKSLQEIYRILAGKRYAIALELGHGAEHLGTSDYGSFRVKGNPAREDFYTKKRDSVWNHQSSFMIEEFLGSTVKTVTLDSPSFAGKIVNILKHIDTLGLEDKYFKGASEEVLVAKRKLLHEFGEIELNDELQSRAFAIAIHLFETAKPQGVDLKSLKTKEDLSDEILGKLFDTIARNKGKIIYPEKSVAINIPTPNKYFDPYSPEFLLQKLPDQPGHLLQVAYMKIDDTGNDHIWTIANNHFQDAMKATTPEEFSLHAGKMMYMMARMLPVKLGNCGIMEWLVVAAANSKGYDFDFKREKGLGWDFKALVATNQDEYAKWFQSKVICKEQTITKEQDHNPTANPHATSEQSLLSKLAKAIGLKR